MTFTPCQEILKHGHSTLGPGEILVRRSQIVILSWLLLLATDDRAAADPRPKETDAPASSLGIDPIEVARWPVEKIVLKNQKRLEGLIQFEGPQHIEFVEIRRKPGEPMRRVFRWIPLERVEDIERLGEKERTRLSLRLREYMRRTEILERLLGDIELVPSEFEGRPCLKYDGRWYTLRSRADEETTRLAIVRLEQVFAGFRTYLAPRRRHRETLQIVILGSAPEYQRLLKSRDLDIRQTAYYDPDNNEIVAGGQLASVAAELDDVRAYHEVLVSELREKQAEAEKQIETLGRTLRDAGEDPRQVSAAMRAARDQWKKIRQSLDRRIRQANWRNDALYHQAFRHLYHEAFHAYLGNFVIEDAATTVPRWLNEGWAQIFEAGLLEAGTLRVDAPSPERLERLQRELRGDSPLELKHVVTAPVERFIVGYRHRTSDQMEQDSRRVYLYSWGLAYHLTFHRKLLGSSALDTYLKASEPGAPPDDIARFEKLVGEGLDQFEKNWRQAMLAERIPGSR